MPKGEFIGHEIPQVEEVATTKGEIPEVVLTKEDEKSDQPILEPSEVFEMEDGLLEKYAQEVLDYTPELKKIPERYHTKIALKLIDDGEYETVVENLEKFQGLDYIEIAQKLIEAGDAEDIAFNLEKFQGLNHSEIALKIIEAGHGRSVALSLEKFQGLNHKEIAEKLIEAGQGCPVVDNLEKFQGLDHNKIALKIIEAGEGASVARYLEKFQGVDYKEIAEKLIETGQGDNIAFNLEKFQGLNHGEIALKIIEAGQGKSVAKNLKKFQGLNHSDIALKIIESGDGGSVAVNLEKFQGLDYKEIVLKIIEAGQGDSVASNLEKFQGVDNKEIAQKLIEIGQGETVAQNLFHFKGLDDSIALKLISLEKAERVLAFIDSFNKLDQEVAKKLMKAGYERSVLKKYYHFKDLSLKDIALGFIENDNMRTLAYDLDMFPDNSLDQEIAMKLLEAGEGLKLAQYIKSFQGLDKEIAIRLIQQGQFGVVKELSRFEGLDQDAAKVLIDELLKAGNFILAMEVNRHFNGFDKTLNKTNDIFSGRATVNNFRMIKGLIEGELSEEQRNELALLGVNKEGYEGIEQMREVFSELRKDAVFSEVPMSLMRDSESFRSFYKSMVRYENSDWGEHTDDEFNKTVDYYAENKERFRRLPEVYKPSPVLLIDRINKDKQDSHQYSEGFLHRYAELVNSLQEARTLIDEEGGLTPVIDGIKNKCQEITDKTQEQLVSLSDAKARNFLQKRLEKLQALDFNQPDLQKSLSILFDFKKEFSEELRQIVFWLSFKFNPEQQKRDLSQLETGQPKIEDVSWVLNFIDHITNKETFSQYFTDKKALKDFKKLLNVNALQEELTNAQDKPTRGKMKMQFVPARNLTTEFSGHIADACWASKYQSILEEYPDFISLNMVMNPGERSERLAGAAMLIEAKNSDGEPLLIIRGLNPQENIINQLSVKDFYKQLIDYLQPVAEAGGRKLAIVIDNECGHAATNRPVLFEYLAEDVEPKLHNAVLDHESEEYTEFNNYDIQGDVKYC